MKPGARNIALWSGAFLFLVGILVALIIAMSAKPPGPLASVPLADGRILQIEGVTYGKEHRIGQPTSVIGQIAYWLPPRARAWLQPKRTESQMTTAEPTLVVWVNTIDAATGKPVDCQRLRVEFIDENRDLFGTYTSSWTGSQNFWRVGHAFSAFPRAEHSLTLLITPWKTNVTARLQIPNPCLTLPASWTGRPAPQHTNFGNIEISLAALQLRTNGGPKRRWETPARYWHPDWQIRRDGQPAIGWDEPEWIAEDPLGNRDKYLGAHQPVLLFTATFYPAATNTEAAALIATLPQTTELGGATNIVWWNIKTNSDSRPLEILGLFPKGTHVFNEGLYVTNPAPSLRTGPTSGGAPSGWVWTSERVTPITMKYWAGHYTPSPVIYVHAPDLASPNRLGIRLRDDQGRYWTAKPEPQGAVQDILPFLVQLPAEVTNVVPELVLLRPLHVGFLVDTQTDSKK